MGKLFAFGLAGALLAGSGNAWAFSSLRCKDAGGKSLFKGFVADGEGETGGKFQRERTVSFSQAVATKAKMVIDRQSLSRINGIELPNCKGPYAYVYERAKAGSLRCASGELKVLEGFELSDAAIFQSFGLSKDDSDCSLITDAK